eukprot:TRINITY_DN5073_c0_g1_i2.p1 TRINITY_DN5073_c0_g1~~TRINITY_DN5073_c0_g1_i2.p1  ORF type:complete len:316 (-),score=38.83 TRINITY_DN5073_c0_g1_i2:33-980(-)
MTQKRKLSKTEIKEHLPSNKRCRTKGKYSKSDDGNGCNMLFLMLQSGMMIPYIHKITMSMINKGIFKLVKSSIEQDCKFIWTEQTPPPKQDKPIYQPKRVMLQIEDADIRDEFNDVMDEYAYFGSSKQRGKNLEYLCHKLPASITDLELAYCSNMDLTFPPSITHLMLGSEDDSYSFDRPLIDLPATITHLTLGDQFNQAVDNLLPSSITHLKFGFEFNQSVDNLPPSITHLKFGNQFNQPVNNLPSSIIFLGFDCYFNQPVDHLPGFITHLEFGDFFNQPVNNLPPSLTHLRFSENSDFDQPVDHLPSALTFLK